MADKQPSASTTASHGAEMSFWEHLDVLRGVLFKAIGVVTVLSVAYFLALPHLMESVIFAPCHDDFPLYHLFARLGALSGLMPDFALGTFDVDIINIRLASQFFLHISLSFWLAVVTAFPFILYLLWTFVEPALLPTEKRGVTRAFLLGTFMFYAGIAVGYFVVFPLTLRFLASYSLSDSIHNQLSLDSYMDNFLMLNLVMGLVFELPLVAWLLGRAGILKRSFFVAYRRHAVVALLVLAAIITPTGDPFTLLVVFIPIYFLWELAAYLVPAHHKS